MGNVQTQITIKMRVLQRLMYALALVGVLLKLAVKRMREQKGWEQGAREPARGSGTGEGDWEIRG